MLSDYWLFSTAGSIYSPISRKHTCWCSRLKRSLSLALQLLYQSAGRTCQIPEDREYVVEAERNRKDKRKENRSRKHLFSLASDQILLCLLDTYSLFHLLSRSLGLNIYWQRNCQTEIRQIESQENTCLLSHHIRVSGVSCNDFLCCLNLHTYAEQVPGHVSLSALNSSVRFVWLSGCMFWIVSESSFDSLALLKNLIRNLLKCSRSLPWTLFLGLWGA